MMRRPRSQLSRVVAGAMATPDSAREQGKLATSGRGDRRAEATSGIAESKPATGRRP